MPYSTGHSPLPVIREYAVVSLVSSTECTTRGADPFPRGVDPLGMFPDDVSRSDCSDRNGAWEYDVESECDFLLDLQSISAIRNITWREMMEYER